VQATTYPGKRQLCAIVRQVLTANPTTCEAERKELIKRQHLTLGFLYDHREIPEAMDKVERAIARTTNRRSAHWT